MAKRAQTETYRVHELRAENFKRLQAITIRPDGKAVQIISGRNGQGKTSALDAIVAAVAGRASIQKMPIRKGQKEASIFLDLGQLRIKREFHIGDDGEQTTRLRVENADGVSFRSPQDVLNVLMGDLAFDPLEFTRLDEKSRFDMMKRFVPDIDFDELAQADKKDREDRTALGRRQREHEGAARSINVPIDTPDEPIDVNALLIEYDEASAHNTKLDEANEMLDRAERLRAEANTLEKMATEMLRALPSMARVALEPIKKQGQDARSINAAVQRKQERNESARVARMLEDQYNEITQRIAERERSKQAAIAAARMPIDGLSFGDGAILLNGLPLDQASAAEQLRASTAIAMALNPQLKVILIRDGSLLDQDSLALLAEIAERNDYQVFLERVASGEKVGIVIEDGRIAS